MEFEDLFKDPEHLARTNAFIKKVKTEVLPIYEPKCISIKIVNPIESLIDSPLRSKNSKKSENFERAAHIADITSVEYYFSSLRIYAENIGVIYEIVRITDDISKDFEAQLFKKGPDILTNSDGSWLAARFYRFLNKEVLKNSGL